MQEWGAALHVRRRPLASQGLLQLIHRHTYKRYVCVGGWVSDNASNSNSTGSERKVQDRIPKLSLPKSPAGRRIRAQSRRWPLNEKSPRGSCRWPQTIGPRLERPQDPSTHHPHYAPCHFCTTLIGQEVFLINSRIYFPEANMPRSLFSPRSAAKTSMTDL